MKSSVNLIFLETWLIPLLGVSISSHFPYVSYDGIFSSAVSIKYVKDLAILSFMYISSSEIPLHLGND